MTEAKLGLLLRQVGVVAQHSLQKGLVLKVSLNTSQVFHFSGDFVQHFVVVAGKY